MYNICSKCISDSVVNLRAFMFIKAYCSKNDRIKVYPFLFKEIRKLDLADMLTNNSNCCNLCN